MCTRLHIHRPAPTARVHKPARVCARMRTCTQRTQPRALSLAVQGGFPPLPPPHSDSRVARDGQFIPRENLGGPVSFLILVRFREYIPRSASWPSPVSILSRKRDLDDAGSPLCPVSMTAATLHVRLTANVRIDLEETKPICQRLLPGPSLRQAHSALISKIPERGHGERGARQEAKGSGLQAPLAGHGTGPGGADCAAVSPELWDGGATR